jgi:hypothetical protein
MIKLALAAAAGTAVLVATATGGIDELRSQLPDVRTPFNEVNAALNGAQTRERQWHNVVKQANSICARHPQRTFVLRPALPPNRARYLRAIGTELDRERNIQSDLIVLRPPANYVRPYSLFLRNRQTALDALERVQKATRERSQEDYAQATRLLKQRRPLVAGYAATVGMPACAF